jgi:hypothetical protein
MINVIEPSWEVFEKCSRCGADAGAPCVSMRGTPRGFWPNRAGPLRNPHPGRRKKPRK